MYKKSIFIFLMFISGLVAGQNLIHHQIEAKVDPANHSIEFTDQITIPADQVAQSIHFLLVSDLMVTCETPGVTIILDKSEIKAKDFGMDVEDFSLASSITQNKYKLEFDKNPETAVTISLKMKGEINYEIKQMGAEYARGFSQSPGIICEKGVYLGGSAYWIPWFNENLITFELTTLLPEKWDVVSQGERTVHETINGNRKTTWNASHPMEEVYLIAASFHEYVKNLGAVDVMAFLRTPDENLANKYLETTAQYLEMYRQLIGPYPFSKFALIENFWETGYGMASFTLLGEQVIRFPFILHSSYPHELLHNYWGNSVYVDFKKGNWCEGITAYMADHLIKEQRGQGADYRRSTLQKFTDYVIPENDFPLNKFISRHDASSEAVGYGKCLMMFNMLREEVGDEQFTKSLQKFYRDHKFKFASFDDIRIAFEEVSGKDFKPFFAQWIDRTGAPELSLSGVKSKKEKEGYKLTFVLKQIQKDDVFALDIPLSISYGDKVEMKKVKMEKREQVFEFSLKEKPLQIQIDPQFQLLRKLHHDEIPPSLSKIYGSEKILIVLPSKTDKSDLESYKLLAEKWSKDKTKKIEVVQDKELKKLPADKAVWIFGHKNKFKDVIETGLKDYDAEFSKNKIKLGNVEIKLNESSFIVAVRHPGNPKSVAAWLTIEKPEAVNGLARKLLHYGKYSFLAFEGDDPTNIAKGQWPAVNSPLTQVLDKKAEIDSELSKRKALATLAPVFSADRMMEHIELLADQKLQGRGLGTPGIDKAADYIAEQFEKADLQPGADDDTYFQKFETEIDAKGNTGTVKNVIGIIPGTNPKMGGESVVICAHYDHLGLGWPDVRKGNEGKIHYGADDNASGVAVMLELAQLLGKSLKPQRTIIFVAFTAEENGLVGSTYYVKNGQKYPATKVIGALNLDTVGRLFDNKLMVLNSASAREWKFIFMGAGYVTGVEAEMVTQDLDASDQTSFINAEIPAVQFFSGPHGDYHRPSDTVDKIDAAGLVKVAAFVREGLLYLAEREEPLTFKRQKPAGKHPGHPGGKMKKSGERSASTGSMPDFAYSGEGVKLGAVPDGSAATKAGLKKGDVIIQLGEHPVKNLREYSNALKSHQPGDEVDVVYVREGKEHTAKIVLGER